MAIIPKHLIYAFNYLGMKEIPGQPANPKIAEWLQMVGIPPDDEYAWCAAAMHGILEECGIHGTGKALARSYLNWGDVLTEPKLGCVVIIERGNESWQGHVAFYMDHHNRLVYYMGGNQQSRFGISMCVETRVLGYRWHGGFDL